MTASRYPPVVWQWRHQVQQAVAETGLVLGDMGPSHGPIKVRLGFDLPRLTTHYGTGKNAGQLKDSAPTWPAGRPDLDKLARCVLDAITDAGCIWKDDSQVVRLETIKCYADPPGVVIRIEEL